MLLCCVGCGTVGERFKPLDAASAGRSKVYLYMGCKPGMTEYLGNGQTGATVYVNGKFIGYLSDGTYIPLSLPPGTYKFKFGSTWNWTHPSLVFDYAIGADRTHYFEWTTRLDQYDRNKFWYELIENEEVAATPALQHCILEKDSYLKARNAGLSQ